MKPSVRWKVTEQELEALLERVKGRVDPGDYEILEGLAETLRWLSGALLEKKISIQRLKQMLFGETTEKTKKVLEDAGASKPKEKEEQSGARKKPKGHGRNGAKDYPGARRVPVRHQTLKPGSCCPSCKKGKVHGLKEPGKVIAIVGQPFLSATVYEPQRLRCGSCGEVFTAGLPEEAPKRKYDETAQAMVGLLKYGTGFPFYRMETFQNGMGVPLPAATQWEIVLSAALEMAPVYEELIRQAAQGEVVYNDDTGMTILALGEAGEKESEPEEPASKERERTGVFTSGIVATREGDRIALFFTGRRHAGENLEKLLKQRIQELGPPIQMCDGLSRNAPGEFETILANCIAHGRRKFVEVTANFPEQCRYVLERLREVYRNDAVAKKRGLSPEERLAFHQAESGPIMEDLEEYLGAQLEEKRVEPNSGLGKAIAYMLKRWKPLTLFLREPGAPLDNNICERVLKMAILHRKNALFYKTERGAWVGDLFMSLIHTCRLSGVNPFEYLTALLKNAPRVRKDPGAWMPWNYQATLASFDTS